MEFTTKNTVVSDLISEHAILKIFSWRSMPPDPLAFTQQNAQCFIVPASWPDRFRIASSCPEYQLQYYCYIHNIS